VAHVAIDTNLPLAAQALQGAAGWSCLVNPSRPLAGTCDLDYGTALASGAHADFQIVVSRTLLKPSYVIHATVESDNDQNTPNNEGRRRLGMPAP
jgi:hypothetical protein